MSRLNKHRGSTAPLLHRSEFVSKYFPNTWEAFNASTLSWWSAREIKGGHNITTVTRKARYSITGTFPWLNGRRLNWKSRRWWSVQVEEEKTLKRGAELLFLTRLNQKSNDDFTSSFVFCLSSKWHIKLPYVRSKSVKPFFILCIVHLVAIWHAACHAWIFAPRVGG